EPVRRRGGRQRPGAVHHRDEAPELPVAAATASLLPAGRGDLGTSDPTNLSMHQAKCGAWCITLFAARARNRGQPPRISTDVQLRPAALLVVLAFAACGSVTRPGVAATPSPTADAAVLTKLSGPARLSAAAGERAAPLGDSISPGDTLLVPAGTTAL